MLFLRLEEDGDNVAGGGPVIDNEEIGEGEDEEIEEEDQEGEKIAAPFDDLAAIENSEAFEFVGLTMAGEEGEEEKIIPYVDTDEEDASELDEVSPEVLHTLNLSKKELLDDEKDDEHDRKGTMKVVQRLTLHGGMLGPYCSEKPDDIDSQLEDLRRGRSSPPPTREVYEMYRFASTRKNAPDIFAAKEFIFKVGHPSFATYGQLPNQEYTIFRGFNQICDLEGPNPDMIEGFIQNDQHILKWLYDGVDGAAEMIERADTRSSALSWFAGQWTRPGQLIEKAVTQVKYIGAVMVAERHQITRRINRVAMVNKVEFEERGVHECSVRTFIIDGSRIHFFAHFRRKGKAKKYRINNVPEYHMYHLDTVDLNESFESFERGWRYIRNSQSFGARRSNLHFCIAGDGMALEKNLEAEKMRKADAQRRKWAEMAKAEEQKIANRRAEAERVRVEAERAKAEAARVRAEAERIRAMEAAEARRYAEEMGAYTTTFINDKYR